MKLLVLSHASVTPENQAFFQKIAEVSGWQVTIIVPANWKTDFKDIYTIEQLLSFKGSLIPVPVYLAGKAPLHIYKWPLLKYLYAEKPDMIYVQNEAYSIAAFQAVFFNFLVGRRCIGFYAAQNIAKRHPLPFRLMERFVFSHADFCTSVTDSAGAIIRDKGFKGHIVTLPLGVREDQLCGDEGETTDDQRRGPAVPIIGYIGRLVQEKGVDVLLRALAVLQEKPWRCQIIGDGPLRASLVSLADELGIAERVTFLGYVGHGDVSAYLRKFWLLVLPSKTTTRWAEQFGRVIVEALAVKVPVIGSDSGEIPFLIAKLDGGLVVKEDDPAGLAEVIGKILDSPPTRHSFAEAGFLKVKAHFTESRIAEQFVAALRDVMVRRATATGLGTEGDNPC